jgi:hypothetical protein
MMSVVNHPYHATILEQYKDNLLEYIPGHRPQYGREAYNIKNPLWRVREDDGEEVLLMLCEPDNQICKLCPESYQVLLDYEKSIGKKISWCIGKVGYAANSVIKLFLHQVITGCHGNGKGTGTISVDHINRNRLDNRKINLRVVGQQVQIANSKGVLPGTKKERQVNARQLPEGITQDMMRKYVNYLKEVYDKKSGKTREFFRVENHPNADKDYASSKSRDVSIFDKLREANKIAEDLDNGILPEAKVKKFPSGVSMNKDGTHLSFDKRIGGVCYSFKMKLPADCDIDEGLEKLIDRIKMKYPDQSFF